MTLRSYLLWWASLFQRLSTRVNLVRNRYFPRRLEEDEVPEVTIRSGFVGTSKENYQAITGLDGQLIQPTNTTHPPEIRGIRRPEIRRRSVTEVLYGQSPPRLRHDIFVARGDRWFCKDAGHPLAGYTVVPDLKQPPVDRCWSCPYEAAYVKEDDEDPVLRRFSQQSQRRLGREEE